MPLYKENKEGKITATTSALVKSRRIGGTWATTLRNIFLCCGIDPSTGKDIEPMDAYFCSSTMRQSREVVDECCDLARQLAKKDSRFEFTNTKLSVSFTHANTRFNAIPASPRSIRGSTGSLTLDEICFQQNFEDIFRAAKAVTFSNIKNPKGYPLHYLSTPWSSNTLQHQLLTGIGDSFSGIQRMAVSYEDALAAGFPGATPESVIEEYGSEAYNVEFNLQWLSVGTCYFPIPLLEKSKIDIVPDDMVEKKQVTGKMWLESHLKDAPRIYGVDVGATHDLSCITEIADLGEYLVIVNQSILRGVPVHQQAKLFIEYIENVGEPISCIRIDRGSIGRAVYDEMHEFYDEAVEAFDGNMRRQLSHCKNLKSLLEKNIIKTSNTFIDRFSGSKRTCSSLFMELNKIALDLTVAGNVTVKTPRDEMGHSDMAWSLLIATGRSKSMQGAEIFPENAVIQGHSVYGDGSLIYPPERDGFMESIGIFGFTPIPERKVLTYLLVWRVVEEYLEMLR